MRRSDRVLMWLVTAAVAVLAAGASAQNRNWMQLPAPYDPDVGGGIYVPEPELHIDCWPKGGLGPMVCGPRSGRVDGAAGSPSMSIEGASRGQ